MSPSNWKQRCKETLEIKTHFFLYVYKRNRKDSFEKIVYLNLLFKISTDAGKVDLLSRQSSEARVIRSQ